jgi:hemoglobin
VPTPERDLAESPAGGPTAAARADITDTPDRADLERLIRAFYERAYADDLIGFVFTDVTHMDLEAHLPVMCDFWSTVLFRSGLYRRNALAVHTDIHARSAFTAEQFGRWLELWSSTVDELFAGEKAELAKRQAARIAWSMSRRLLGESGSEFVTITRASEPPGPVIITTTTSAPTMNGPFSV